MSLESNLDFVIISGFADKGVKQFEQSLNAKFQPRGILKIASTPWYRALENPETIVHRAIEIIENSMPFNNNGILVLAHSYGALIALIVACRLRFESILKLILIDGPINPNVAVKPAKLKHYLFFRHYLNRRDLASECAATLLELHAHSKIVTIGSTSDTIVPPEAKRLDDHFQNIELQNDNPPAHLNFTDKSRGINIILPPSYQGHGLLKKIPLIANIIQKILENAT